MDAIDLEIQEMLKNPVEVFKSIEDDDTTLNDIFDMFPGRPKFLKKALNIPLKLTAAEIMIRTGGFRIYTDKGSFFGNQWDNCDVKLQVRLSESKGVEVYHNKDGAGYYVYVFKEPVDFKVILKGKILKSYDFEVN